MLSDSDERLFLQIVDAGSLSAAARQWRTTTATVSRRLARLEARLQVKLWRRSTRHSEPTDAGARLAEHLRRFFGEHEALVADLRGEHQAPRGRLRVAAPVDFGARFVVPVVARMQAEAPELVVEIHLGSDHARLVEQGLDVAVRIGRLSDSALKARRLGAVPRVLVASPGYLAQAGTPRTPADLSAHDFVLYRPGNDGARLELKPPDGPVQAVRVRGKVAVNSVTGVVTLVEAGRGLHLGPVWAMAEALAAGRLVAVLPDHGLRAYPLHAVYPASAWLPARVRAFIDGMAAALPDTPGLIAGPAPDFVAPGAPGPGR